MTNEIELHNYKDLFIIIKYIKRSRSVLCNVYITVRLTSAFPNCFHCPRDHTLQVKAHIKLTRF